MATLEKALWALPASLFALVILIISFSIIGLAGLALGLVYLTMRSLV